MCAPGQPRAASDPQVIFNSCSHPPTCHLSLGRKKSLSCPPCLLLPGSGKRPVFRSLVTLPHHTSPPWFPSSEKQNFLRAAVWEPRGAARVCEGAEAGEEAAVLGRRKEPALGSAPCPFPAASAVAVTTVAAVRSAASRTMQGAGSRGAWIHSPSHCPGRARGLTEGERGLPRSGRTPVRGRETEAGSGACRVRAVASPAATAAPAQARPRWGEPGGLGRSRWRAASAAPECSSVLGLSLGWPARTLWGRRARLGEVWELQPAPPVGLLAAHFRVWTVTRRAAQAEGTHSIFPRQHGPPTNPSDDIELSGRPLFNNDLRNSLSENQGNECDGARLCC